MIITYCYLVLYLITAYVVINCIYISKKTSSLILAAPIAVMYYWSIFGAWSWIPMKLNGEYDFYESIMFTVDIDKYYLESLILYSIFIVVFTSYVRHVANHSVVDKQTLDKRRASYKDYIDILNDSVLYKLIAFGLLVVYVKFSMKDLSIAMSQGVSAYQLSRFHSSLGGLGSMVSFFGDTFLYLTIPLVFSRKRLIKNIFVWGELAIYFSINMLLGNRGTMLCGLIMAIILCAELYGLRKTFKPKYILIAILVLSGIQMISFVRGMPVIDILSGNYDLNFWEILRSTTQSQEQYASQISMYGVLKNDVAFTYGTSVWFLLSTLIPSFLGLPRPERIYMYYVYNTIHGKPDIGVTLHHATAWYLNFGYIGIVMGALLWGFVLKFFFKRRDKYIYFYGATVFSAVSVQMIRDSGPESYKGCLLLSTIIPMLIAYYCIKQKRIII